MMHLSPDVMRLERELKRDYEPRFDAEKEYKGVAETLRGKDDGQFARILQNAHMSLYKEHLLKETIALAPPWEQKLRDHDHRNSFVQAIWAVAIINEANRRLGQQGKPSVAISKDLSTMTASDIFPGSSKRPITNMKSLEGVMTSLGVPVEAGRQDMPAIDLDNPRVSAAAKKAGFNLTPTTERILKAAIVDKTGLYEGKAWNYISEYDGGMSDAEVAASRARLSQIKVT
jgi:hypothetical protein